MSRTFREVLLDRVCQVERWIRTLFGFCIALLLFMLVSFVVVDSESGTYVVVVFNLVGLSIIAIVSGAVLLICRNRQDR